MQKQRVNMSKNSFSVSLPFIETIRRSYGYFFGHLELLVKVSAAWFILIWGADVLAGFPSLCSVSSENCASSEKQILSFVILGISSIAVIIAYIRGVVLHIVPAGYGTLEFGKRELNYIGKGILFFIIAVIPALFLGFFAGFIGGIFQADSRVYAGLSFLSALVCVIIAFRFYLAFPAVAVDNREIDFQKSFAITKGNTNKIFWGLVVMMLPGWISLMVLALIYRSLNTDIYLIKMLLAALTLTISFVDVGLKASYLAHLYQYFIYFYQKWQKEENK